MRGGGETGNKTERGRRKGGKERRKKVNIWEGGKEETPKRLKGREREEERKVERRKERVDRKSYCGKGDREKLKKEEQKDGKRARRRNKRKEKEKNDGFWSITNILKLQCMYRDYSVV